MNISPVSFSGAAAGTGSFQDKIKQPQTYVLSPTAASELNEEGKGKKSKAKKVIAAIVVVAAAAAGIAIGARKGLFNPAPEGGNKILETVKAGLKTTGNFIADKASAAKNFISSKLAKESTGGTVTAGASAPVEASEIVEEFMA